MECHDCSIGNKGLAVPNANASLYSILTASLILALIFNTCFALLNSFIIYVHIFRFYVHIQIKHL